MVLSLLPGSKLGRFVILRLLGSGGMGAVFLARDEELDVAVALKVLSTSVTDTQAYERFKREVLLARRIVHPAICRIYDLHREQGVHFISMEYVEGPTLLRMLGTCRILSQPAAAGVIRLLCDAVGAAHLQGVIHRDVKPSNVVVRARDSVSLLDFGVSKAPDVKQLTEKGCTLGTISYLAPELLLGDEPTPQSDIYSTGITFYQCLTGRRPFAVSNVAGLHSAIVRGEVVPPRNYEPGLHPALDAIVARATALQPARRFVSIQAFRDALQRAIDAGLPEDPRSEALFDAVIDQHRGLLEEPFESVATVPEQGIHLDVTSSARVGKKDSPPRRDPFLPNAPASATAAEPPVDEPLPVAPPPVRATTDPSADEGESSDPISVPFARANSLPVTVPESLSPSRKTTDPISPAIASPPANLGSSEGASPDAAAGSREISAKELASFDEDSVATLTPVGEKPIAEHSAAFDFVPATEVDETRSGSGAGATRRRALIAAAVVLGLGVAPCYALWRVREGAPSQAPLSEAPRETERASGRRLAELVQRLERQREAKGLRRGDSPSIDRELEKLAALRQRGSSGEAERVAARGLQAIEETRIDRDFVEAKLLRFDKHADRTYAAEIRQRLLTLSAAIQDALDRDDHEHANRLLNQAFDLTSKN